MSLSTTTTTNRQMHTILGGGIRYETAELLLTTIPNFELKQKGRILHLFTEIYNAFMQEIQEALDERQNQFDHSLAQPFAFESQIDPDLNPLNLSLKSSNESIESDKPSLKESLPLLIAPKNIKKEIQTSPKSRRYSSKSKRKNISSNSSMRQMTMTQLFDPIESPQTTTTTTTRKTNSIKQEPNTPSDDTPMFMPESLIGLAQPSESLSNTDNEQNTSLDLISPALEKSILKNESLKRKSIPSPVTDENISESPPTDEEEFDIQNDALIQTPYENIDNEELLNACPMCRNYWLGLPEELRDKQGLTCRHRQRPMARTPEHFWSLGIPSTQTCIQRGYGGVLPPEKPIERPRRPRRQYHRRIQQQEDHE